jgi:hypothetical protein
MSVKEPCIYCGKKLDILGMWWAYVWRNGKTERGLVGYKCHPKKPCDPEKRKEFRAKRRKIK